MKPKETQEQRVLRVAQEIGSALRTQVRGRWKGVRTAERNERNRHVWRFQAADENDRFLHIEHSAMADGKDAATRLLAQLESERWLDRLHQGPETALLLSSDGQVSTYTKR